MKYTPCKSVGQLKAADKYMLGKRKDQIKDGVVKTAPDLYTALGCERDNFSNNILVTRKLQGKSYSKLKEKDILAHKMSISFHPDDNSKLNHQLAFQIAKEFAERYFHSKGYEVLLAVHTDTEHIHAHFLISNCNMDTGKSYQRSQKDLHEMSAFFGQQCLEHGLVNSVRDTFYNKDLEKPKRREGLAEKEMKKRGAETFKDELREVIEQEIADPLNRTFDDVIKALQRNWNVETRVAGNTVSYKHPEYKDKNDNLVSVRGSKLGDMYTRKGIEYELTKNQKRRKRKSANPTGEYSVLYGAARGDESRGQAGSGGQIPSSVDVGNARENLQGIDRFYDRYRKPVGKIEPQPEQNYIPPRTVRK